MRACGDKRAASRRAAAFVILAVLAASALWTPAVLASSPLVLPIPPGQTWYVCQGYNGQITHHGTPALDLSLTRKSVGSQGCLAGTKYTSAGSVVSSPAAGTAYRTPGFAGDDFVCVNFDFGGSAAIGHLDNRIASGTRVQTGARIGTVAWPEYSNGDYSHVHIQVHPAPDCTEGSDPSHSILRTASGSHALPSFLIQVSPTSTPGSASADASRQQHQNRPTGSWKWHPILPIQRPKPLGGMKPIPRAGLGSSGQPADPFTW